MNYLARLLSALTLLAACASVCLAQHGNTSAQANSPAAQKEEPLPQTFSGQDGEPAFKAADVTRKARLLDKPQPGYTEEAKKQGVDGSVLLRMVLSSSGEITNISVVEGLPYGLTEKAIEAAKKIKFEPALKNGKPVSQYVAVEYNFNIYSEDEVSQKAVIISKPQPEYTEEARRVKYSGVVVVRAILMKNGEIKRIGFLNGLPPHGLKDKVMEAARQIKFTPAELKGRPVSQYTTIEYRFPLNE